MENEKKSNEIPTDKDFFEGTEDISLDNDNVSNESFDNDLDEQEEYKTDETDIDDFNEIETNNLNDETNSDEGGSDDLNTDDLDDFDDFDDFKDLEDKGSVDNEQKEVVSISKDASVSTAKWIIDILIKFILTLLKEWVKIDQSKVYQAIIDGEIDERFLPEIEKSNQSIDDDLKISESDKQLLVSSLVQSTEGKPIVVSPVLKFVSSLIVVFLPIALNIKKIKKRQDMILYSIKKKTEEIKEAQSNSNNNSKSNQTNSGIDVEYVDNMTSSYEQMPDDYDNNEFEEI